MQYILLKIKNSILLLSCNTLIFNTELIAEGKGPFSNFYISSPRLVTILSLKSPVCPIHPYIERE